LSYYYKNLAKLTKLRGETGSNMICISPKSYFVVIGGNWGWSKTIIPGLIPKGDLINGKTLINNCSFLKLVTEPP
jgi:hypothetical protein